MRGVPAMFVGAAALGGCGQGQTGSRSAAGLQAATTISVFDSFVRAVAGPGVTVASLVPVGASPEDYQPTPRDTARLHDAAILFKNGVGLEVWLDRTIANASNAALHVVTLTHGLTPVANNPHLWMNPQFARAYVRNVRDGLIALNAEGRDDYVRNAAAYDARLVALDHSIAQQILTIPVAQRSMIVFHNAFDYYNARYGIASLGVIERSPGQEPSPGDLAHLVDLARTHHVRAVFSEPQSSPKLAQTLAQSAGISLVTNLYDDTVGTGGKALDYEAMLRYDTRAIVLALGGRSG